MFIKIFRVLIGIVARVLYVMTKPKAEVIFSNIPGPGGEPTSKVEDVINFCKEHMKQFGKSSFGHLIISCGDPSLGYDKIRWNELVLEVRHQMGLAHSLCVIALHKDTDTPHAHGVLSYFRIEFLLGEDFFIESDYERLPMEVVRQHFKKNEGKINSLLIGICRDVENRLNLKRNSVNIHISTERYINPAYSIKYHLRLAYEEVLSKVVSMKEFLQQLPVACEKHLTTLINNVKNLKNSRVIPYISESPKVELAITPSPIKQFEERVLLKIGQFKISDYKIFKGLDLASVRNKIVENANKFMAAGNNLLNELQGSGTSKPNECTSNPNNKSNSVSDDEEFKGKNDPGEAGSLVEVGEPKCPVVSGTSAKPFLDNSKYMATSKAKEPGKNEETELKTSESDSASAGSQMGSMQLGMNPNRQTNNTAKDESKNNNRKSVTAQVNALVEKYGDVLLSLQQDYQLRMHQESIKRSWEHNYHESKERSKKSNVKNHSDRVESMNAPQQNVGL